MLDSRCKITLARTEDKIYYCIEHYLDGLEPRQVLNGSILLTLDCYFELVQEIDKAVQEFINKEHN